MKTLSVLFFIAVAFLLGLSIEAAKATAPNISLTAGVAVPMTTDRVCATAWGKDARHVTDAMKHEVFTRYGMTGNDDAKCTPDVYGRRCEIDHVISRELAGADDVNNLQAQPYGGTCNASQKDRLENRLHKLVCNGALSLTDAQQALVNDWRMAYKTYINQKGCGDD